MTATDELRRLLDERGVEWSGTSFSTPAKGHPTNTSLGEEHHEATFIEYDDGNVLRLFDLTPEQAIEATLGRWECQEAEAENAKLRERIKELESCIRGDAEGIYRLAKNTGYLHMDELMESIHNRMRELGVEV